MTQKVRAFLKDQAQQEICILVLAGISLGMSYLFKKDLPLDPAWFSIVFCGIPIIKNAVTGLVTDFDIRADVLVSLALIASIWIGEVFAAGEIALIMQVGALLEDRTVAKARAGIEKLVHLTPAMARVIRENAVSVVPAEQVQIGDFLRVLPGETVPVDGLITDGQTSINQAVMTGESLPVDKEKGDEVFSGTVNQFGTFDMRVTKVGEDSSIRRMIRLVQSADAGKAKIVRLADRWATWIVIAALTSAFLTWVFSGEVIRAVTILVVFCPCALVLATPTAIMAAIGNATRHGFLVREGDALERLAAIKRVAFDKTGTLTFGKPEVMAVRSIEAGLSDEMLYSLAASAELRSEHPLGKAVVRCYQRDTAAQIIPDPEKFVMHPGRGVIAVVQGRAVLAGNPKLFAENRIDIPKMYFDETEAYVSKGCTIIFLAVNGQSSGFIALSDVIRSNAQRIVVELKSLGLIPVLLTGDNEKSAGYIAAELGIEEVYSGCYPEEKLRLIGCFQEQKQPVCMLGDGLNDAPALKKAQVGIAMGGIGSDITVEAADIVLIDDDISQFPHLIQLAKHMMSVIKINLAFSLGLNFLAILLAISGVLNPVVGALVHNAGSVLVILNSAVLLNWNSGNKTAHRKPE